MKITNAFLAAVSLHLSCLAFAGGGGADHQGPIDYLICGKGNTESAVIVLDFDPITGEMINDAEVSYNGKLIYASIVKNMAIKRTGDTFELLSTDNSGDLEVSVTNFTQTYKQVRAGAEAPTLNASIKGKLKIKTGSAMVEIDQTDTCSFVLHLTK